MRTRTAAILARSWARALASALRFARQSSRAPRLRHPARPTHGEDPRDGRERRGAKTTVNGAANPSAASVMTSASTQARAGSSSVRAPAARATSQPLVGNEASSPTPRSSTGAAAPDVVLVDGREIDLRAGARRGRPRRGRRSSRPIVTSDPKNTQRTFTGSSARLSAERTADRLGGAAAGDRRERRELDGTREGRPLRCAEVARRASTRRSP